MCEKLCAFICALVRKLWWLLVLLTGITCLLVTSLTIVDACWDHGCDCIDDLFY